MPKPVRLVLISLVALLALPVAAVRAATHMPIGFYDDASFRWSAERTTNIEDAAAAGASVIHTTANWPQIAPKQPARASNGNDPQYRLGDLDELVANAAQNGMRVMININGTPKWANGGKTPNHMPKRLSDLTTFSRMLADRYDGSHGHGTVKLWSVWNEPNLPALPDAAVLGQEDRQPGELREALQGRLRRDQGRQQGRRRSRSARPRTSAATSRSGSAARASRSLLERSRGSSRSRRG